MGRTQSGSAEPSSGKCRVGHVSLSVTYGAIHTAARHSLAPPTAGHSLSPMRSRAITGTPAYLEFEHSGSPVAPRGIAVASGHQSEMQVVVTDGVQVPKHRAGNVSRWWRAHGSTARLVTMAISRPSKPSLSTSARPECSSNAAPDLASGYSSRSNCLDRDPTPIRCDAHVVRRTPTHLALEFAELGEVDQTRLAVVVDRQPHRGV